MAETKACSRSTAAALVVLAALVTTVAGCAPIGGGAGPVGAPEEPSVILPWEWWRDLATVAVVPDGDRVVMSSSACPTGCEFDRHSPDDPRFLRINDHGEGVIFSADGAGAVTRIWMVMGDGVSSRLDGSIRIRVRIDGRRRPVVDLPLPELFSGETPPFVAPLVADRASSGGGHVSYVPIPFRAGCEISLAGAEDAKIWYQVVARLVDDPGPVRPFTGRESSAGFRAVLERAGSDPWGGGPYDVTSGSATLPPGGARTIAELDGPDIVNGIIIRTVRENWNRLGLRFTFDDGEPILVPINDLFGVARVNQQVSRSLLFGGDSDDDLYCYFPMPFFDHVRIELMRRPVEGPPGVTVEYAIRRAGEAPRPGSGIFGVQIRSSASVPPDQWMPILDLEGHGTWVGLFATFSPNGEPSWGILEGDERVFIDGESDPSWHGTGVEDLFGGGFYFRGPDGEARPFLAPLHGAPVLRFHHRVWPGLYRLMLGDAVVFQRSVRAEIEQVSPTGEDLRIRTVGFRYLRPDGAMEP